MAAEAETPKADCVTLLQLTQIFGGIGMLAWGGGGSTLSMMHSEFCLRRSVLTETEFQVLFGISRVLPGMNLLSLTVLIGHQTHGVIGAVGALTGLTLPSFTLIILGCLLFRDGHPNPILAGAARGLAPAAAALLLHMGWQLCAASLRKERALSQGLWALLLLGTTALSLRTSIHPAWMVVGGAAFGAVLCRWVGERGAA